MAKYKNEYYLFSKGGTTSSYFLEYAGTLQGAENDCYEDIEAYSVKSSSEEEIIRIIKETLVE